MYGGSSDSSLRKYTIATNRHIDGTHCQFTASWTGLTIGNTHNRNKENLMVKAKAYHNGSVVNSMFISWRITYPQ